MPPIQKSHVLGLAIGVGLAGPLGALAYKTAAGPQLATTARPLQLRWLDEGPGRATRFALGVATMAGTNPGAHEIVCEHDGTVPRLDGVVVSNTSLAAICTAMPAFDSAITTAVAASATTFVSPVTPADMASAQDLSQADGGN